MLARVEQGERLYLELRLLRVSEGQIQLVLEAGRGVQPLLGDWQVAPASSDELVSHSFCLEGARPARIQVVPGCTWGEVKSHEDLRFAALEGDTSDTSDTSAARESAAD